MESALFYVVMAFGGSIVINLVLKRFGISQIIGYILTGTIMVYAFDLDNIKDSHTLGLVGEFGIVFLMFTIGLEISLQRLGSMKGIVFGNGLAQVGLSAIIFYLLAYYVFGVDATSAVIIALAFSLSSTAVVLTYLKKTKDIYAPYGQRAMGMLIFQDIAVIPILLLIGFLSSDGDDIGLVLLETAGSAIVIIGLLFIVGKRVMTWLLHFSAQSNEEELFIGSVLVIVMGASLLAHAFGFTYSLGAFVAGMIIAETKYLHKVESDIDPFKNLLLGTFFVTVGMKIDLLYFVEHIGEIIGILVAILLIKASIIFIIVRINSNKTVAFESAFSLAQVGEFSFAIFALASHSHLLEEQLVMLITLVVVLSMIITPFMMNNLSRVVDWVFKEELIESDFSSVEGMKNHVVVCGYSIVGKFVSAHLEEMGAEYVIVDNSLKHVEEGLERGEKIFYGDASKRSVLDALHIEDAAAVIVSLDNLEKKRLVCEEVLKVSKNINLIVKVLSLEEKEHLSDLPITVVVDGKLEAARVLVERMQTCQIEYH